MVNGVRGRSYPKQCICGRFWYQVYDDHAWICHVEACWENEEQKKFYQRLENYNAWNDKKRLERILKQK